MSAFLASAPRDRVRNILAIRLDSAGDVVLMSPALGAVRDALPHARITLLASKGVAAAAPLLDSVDAVMQHEAVWQQPRPGRASPQDERRGMRTIALLGSDGGAARGLSSASVVVPPRDTQRVQEVRGLVIHLLCDLVERAQEAAAATLEVSL